MVYIILVNHKNTPDTLACISSLRLLEQAAYRIVVVDNSLDGGLFAALSQQAAAWQQEDFAHGFCLLQEEEAKKAAPLHWLTGIEARANAGFSAANNVGLRFALKDPAMQYAWLLNNDTEVRGPLMLSNCLRAWKRLPAEVGLVGGKVYYHQHEHKLQCIGGRYNFKTGRVSEVGMHETDTGQYDSPPAAIDYPSGACMMATRRFLEQVGLMNEAYFLYFEELDWALRGRKQGFEVRYMPELFVWHKHGATTGGIYGSKFTDVEFTKSEVKFTKLHNPGARLNIFARGLGRMAKRALYGYFDRLLPIAKAMYTKLPSGEKI